KDAEELMQFMLVDLQKKLEPVGKLDLLDSIARRASAYYDARGDAIGDEDAFLAAVARLGVGRVIETRNDLNGALAEYDKPAATPDRLATQHPDVPKSLERALEAGLLRGDTRVTQGDLTGAVAIFRALLPRAEQLRAAHPSDHNAVHLLYSVHL